MSEAKKSDAPHKSKKKLVTLLAGVLLLAAGGAGAAWFVLKPEAQGRAGEEAAYVAPKPARKALYQTLDVFTVNLQDPRGERFAQVGVTLQYEDADVETALKGRLPAVRNDILLLLSAKTPEELLTPEGKQQLAQQIRATVGKSLGHEERPLGAAGDSGAPRPRKSSNPIQAVLFSQFILQ